MIQMGSLWKQENQISREFIDSVILMISCRVNGPNWRSTIGRDTGAKEQEQGFNVAFEIWLMDSTKKKNSKMGLRKLQYYIPTQIRDPEDDF
jgi:hypothetical protein